MKTGMAWALCGGLAAAAFATPLGDSGPSRYADGAYGFTIEPPAFPKVAPEATFTRAFFFAPPDGGFSPNVNIMINNKATTLEEYREAALAELKAMNLAVTAQKAVKIAGRDALFLEHQGKAQGRDLRWMSVALIERDRVILATATALQSHFADYEKEFRACLESIKPVE